MKTILFAVAGYNLAETGRHIEIAKACRALDLNQDMFNISFMSYGGAYEHYIEEAGFSLKKMEPRLTQEQLAHVRKALSGETLNTVAYFTETEMIPMIENELEYYKEVKPDCVLTGWCHSVLISARVSKIPLVNVLHSTSVTEYYAAGLQSLPDRSRFFFLNWFFSEDQLNRMTSRMILNLKMPATPFNRLGAKYGLSEFNNFVEVLEGDYNLLADIPEWVDLPVRPNLRHIGPLPLRIDGDIPQVIADIPRDKPIVYFAMGSSGRPELIADIVKGFQGKPYRVIAPVEAHIKDLEISIPPNVFVTGFLPAHIVNPMAQVSVIHGGQNTVMNACLSGTPIVGVGMHAEQQANLDACVRKGFAIRLSKTQVTASAVHEAIDKLLVDEEAKQAVEKFRIELLKWNGPENAAKFLQKILI